MTPATTETIAQLLDDIRSMEITVEYYQNRILRKRIAIEEILHGSQAREVPAPEVPEGMLMQAPSGRPHKHEPSVGALIEQVLPEMDSKPFQIKELSVLFRSRFPAYAKKFKRNVYPAFKALLKRGVLTKTGAGYLRTAST